MPRKKIDNPEEEYIQFYPGIEENNIKTISIDRINIDINEFEFRMTKRISDLVEDIRENGQQFPVIVRRISGENDYQVISGFRRVRAIIELEVPEVKAIVRDLDDDMAYKISFMENEKRKNLTGVDKAHAIAKLRVLGKTDEEICETYNIGNKQLGRYEKVGGFPRLLKDAIGSEIIQTSHGLLLVQAHEACGEKVKLSDWVKRVKEEGLSVRQLQRALNKEFGKPKKKVRYFEKHRGGGFRIFPMRFDPINTDEVTKQRIIDALEVAIGLLKA